MSNRRTFLQRAFGAGAALCAGRRLSAQAMQMQMPARPGSPAAQSKQPPTFPFPTPVVTTEVGDLSYTMDLSLIHI